MKFFKRVLGTLLLSLCLSLVFIPSSGMNNDVHTVQAASKVKLNKSKVTMVPKQKVTLKLTGTKEKVQWSSSKKSVATVNAKGQITAKKKGKCIITAQVGDKKYNCKITVVKISSISFKKKSVSLEIEEWGKLKIICNPSKVKIPASDFKWSSSDEDIVKVDDHGEICANSSGSAIITAKIGKYKAKCKVTVAQVYPEAIALSMSSLQLKPGSEKQLTVDIYPSYTTDKTVIWSSSDPKVATVDSNGNVKAIVAGSAYIKATVGNISDSCYVQVMGNTSLSASCGNSLTIKEGESTTIDISTDKGFGTTYSNMGNQGLITSKWGAWKGTIAPLTITANKIGSTNLKIYDNYNPALYIIIQVNVVSPVFIEIPNIPQVISYSSLNRLVSICNVTDIKVETKASGSGYKASINFSGKKTYDYLGDNQSSSCKIGWKLYDASDNVIKSGIAYSPDVAVGESFANVEICIWNLTPGNYKLKVLNVN